MTLPRVSFRSLGGQLVVCAGLLTSASGMDPDPVCSRPDVVFCSGFEESDWRAKWDDYDGNPSSSNQLQIDPGPSEQADNHVMRLRSPAGARGGADLVKVIAPTVDRLYVRWYQKWEPGYNFEAGCHNGGIHAGDRNLLGASDNRPKGNDWYSAWLEPCGEHKMHLYAYYRGMYMDCANPSGTCWGDHLPCTIGSQYCTSPRDNAPPHPMPINPVTDRWYSFEIMAQSGTPTTDTSVIHPDGVLNFWVDGVEYGPFDKRWLRTSADVKLGLIYISLFNHDGTHSDEGIVVDDVVASTSRIGERTTAGAGPKPSNARYPQVRNLSIRIGESSLQLQVADEPGSVVMLDPRGHRMAEATIDRSQREIRIAEGNGITGIYTVAVVQGNRRAIGRHVVLHGSTRASRE